MARTFTKLIPRHQVAKGMCSCAFLAWRDAVVSSMLRVASSAICRHTGLAVQQGVRLTNSRVTRHIAAGTNMQSSDTAADPQPGMRQQPDPLPISCAPRAKAVLEYWFGEAFVSAPFGYMPEQRYFGLWYKGGPDVDAEIKQRFGSDLKELEDGKLQQWDQPYERLASILLADQFTRNVYRGTAKMFSQDAVALELIDRLLAHPDFNGMQPIAQHFALMPLMHSEDIHRHEQLEALLQERIRQLQSTAGCEGAVTGLENMLKFAHDHTGCLRKWGRYPHRNKALGRESTPEEVAGMEDGTIPAW